MAPDARQRRHGAVDVVGLALLDRVEPFGLLIVLVVLVSPIGSFVLGPVIWAVISAILGVTQISPELFTQLHSIISPR